MHVDMQGARELLEVAHSTYYGYTYYGYAYYGYTYYGYIVGGVRELLEVAQPHEDGEAEGVVHARRAW